MKNTQNFYPAETAVSPLDGRNKNKLLSLASYFSEFALNKCRLSIEIQYLQFLAEKHIFKLNSSEIRILNSILDQFDTAEYRKMKQIEGEINHDVKAVEYYLSVKCTSLKLNKLTHYIHLGITSEDLNNLAFAFLLKQFKSEVIEVQLTSLLKQLKLLSKKNASVPLLGRTHGQPAVSTTVGKEFANYYVRLEKIFKKIQNFVFEGKWNGAVGNQNALKVALPQFDWIELGELFVSRFGLSPNRYTTQILPYDNWVDFFHLVAMTNSVLIDLSVNMWQYIMLSVFVQKKITSEVGSSTMPQKVNPINFEHTEGSLQLANSLFYFFSQKLMHSRLQRDLSDSPVRRTFGEAFGYSILGWQSLEKGLLRIEVNHNHVFTQLEDHWEILSEAVQTVLRLRGVDNAYEKIKSKTRGKEMNKNEYKTLLKELGLNSEKKLLELTPQTYRGYAEILARSL